jgi:phosphoribosyl-ATP pyrophosphohydrolase
MKPAKKLPGKKSPGSKLPPGKVPVVKPQIVSAPLLDATVLDRLHASILDRRSADPTISHSARLLARGPAKVAQKFGEEAVECLIEAVAGNPAALIAESADVLYHLLVMWVASGVSPDQVWAELRRREGISGIMEKSGRTKRVLGTSKTP